MVRGESPKVTTMMREDSDVESLADEPATKSGRGSTRRRLLVDTVAEVNSSGSVDVTSPTAIEERRRNAARVGQNMTSVLNGPAMSPTNRLMENVAANVTAAVGWFRRRSTTRGMGQALAGPPIPSVITPVAIEDFAEYRAEYAEPVRDFIALHAKCGGERGGVKGGAIGPEEAAEMLRKCREQVPAEFFEEGFKVDAPKTFSVEAGPEAAVLQEKLSGWLDAVEVALWQNITSQAGSFFGTLTDLSKLNEEVSETLRIIGELRQYMTSIQRLTTQRHLRVIRARRRQRNVLALRTLALHVQQVRATQPTVARLLEESDFGGALDLIDQTQSMLRTQLAGVHCLRTLGRQLEDYKELIGETMAAKFIQLAVSWEPAAASEAVAGHALLAPLARGLLGLKGGRLRSVLAQYRARTVEEVKLVAKTVVNETLGSMRDDGFEEVAPHPKTGGGGGSSSSTPAGGEAGGGSAASSSAAPGGARGERERANVEQLLALSGEQFVSFLGLVFEHLQMVVGRAHGVHTQLVAALDASSPVQSSPVQLVKPTQHESNGDGKKNGAGEGGVVVAAAKGGGGGGGGKGVAERASAALEQQRSAKLREESAEVVGAIADLAQRSVKQPVRAFALFCLPIRSV